MTAASQASRSMLRKYTPEFTPVIENVSSRITRGRFITLARRCIENRPNRKSRTEQYQPGLRIHAREHVAKV
jgi:hypothetical protein